MNLKRGLLFALLLLLFVNLNIVCVSADFSKGNLSHSITTIYGPGKNLEGWINISIENEPVDSLLTDNEDNSITLIDFLKSDPDIIEGTSYTCSPSDCGMGYTGENPEEEKTFTLGIREEKIIGFGFNEDLGNIESVSFDVSSDAPASCDNQLKIDFFGDHTVVVGNNKSSDFVCEGIVRDGCFNETIPEDDLEGYLLTEDGNMFCQRIKLTESPRFRVSVLVSSTDADDEVNVWLYGGENFGDHKGTCSFSPGVDGKKLGFCDIDYATNTEEDYYVCIDAVKDKKTQIWGYKAEGEGCGFYYTGSGVRPEDYAWDISVKGMQFDEVGTISVENELPNGENLADLVKEYIRDKYDWGFDCTSGCFVPIGIVSNVDQDITIGNLTVEYAQEDLIERFLHDFLDLEASPATISTKNLEFKKISLDYINFSLPTAFKNYTYELNLGDSNIFEEEITIEKVPEIVSLSPLLTVSGFPTKLKLKVTLADNVSITNYKWVIDDNVTKTTTFPELEYTFPAIKPAPGHSMKITVTDANGKTATKTFNVIVGTPRDVIDEKLKKMQADLANITEEINNLPVFYQNSVKQQINTAELNTKLAELQRAYAQASVEEDYYPIIDELSNLRIPESIRSGLSTGSVTFYPSTDVINLDSVTGVAGGSYSASEASGYKEGILEWNANYLINKVKYSQIDAVYEEGTETLVNVFEMHIRESISPGVTYYLFVRDMNNLFFDKDYQEKIESGYAGIRIDTADKIITFSTSEDVSFISLPAFISPSLDSVEMLEIEEEPEPGIRWALFILILFFLVIVGFVIYIILQHWYKTKYETYLFKNRNYLFNLVNYIHAQKEKGVKESEMIKKLKKQGWNSEQITYVMRKYLGKRTGMWEIPVEKLLNIFRKKKAAPMTMAGARPGARPPIGPRAGPRTRPPIRKPRRGFSPRR